MKQMAMALAVGLTVASSTAFALDQLDDLKNVCSYTATAQEARLINATAFLVPVGSVHANPDGTYNIDTAPLTELNPGQAFCSDSRFYGEPAVVGGRTGVLIAPNLILTAGHANPVHPQNWKVVFRHSQATGGGMGCTNFTWTNIPAADVYTPVTDGTVVNTFVSDTTTPMYDYLVFQLTANVVGRQPVKIRRSGAPAYGNVTISPGYPNHTAEKISSAAIYLGPETDPGETQGESVYGNFLNGFSGSSGSAVFDTEDETIDAVVRGSIETSNIDTGRTCWYAAETADSTTVFNQPIVNIASSIPQNEIRVTPLDYVVHKSALGSTALPVTTYNVNKGLSGAVIFLNNITGPTGPATTTPVVSTSLAPGLYTVPANGMSFNFNANTSAITQCGAWDYELNVQDASNNLNNYVRHRFEVGLLEVTATPEDAWNVEDFGPTFSQTRTYTVKNVRPSPTTVEVYAGGELPSSVLTINGTTGTKTATLGAAGSWNDTATFVVGFNSTIASLTNPQTDYHLFVDFAHTNYQCSAQDVVERDIVFRRAERVTVAGTPTLLANPSGGQTYGTATRYDFDLTTAPSGACVKDLNLDIGSLSPPGSALSSVVSSLKVTLTAPTGQSAVLWDRNAYPGGAYGIEDTLGGYTVDMLHLDDQVTPPLGPSLLGFFIGRTINGHWYLDVQSAGGAIDVIGPNRIDISSKPTCLSP